MLLYVTVIITVCPEVRSLGERSHLYTFDQCDWYRYIFQSFSNACCLSSLESFMDLIKRGNDKLVHDIMRVDCYELMTGCQKKNARLLYQTNERQHIILKMYLQAISSS